MIYHVRLPFLDARCSGVCDALSGISTLMPLSAVRFETNSHSTKSVLSFSTAKWSGIRLFLSVADMLAPWEAKIFPVLTKPTTEENDGFIIYFFALQMLLFELWQTFFGCNV